LGQRQQKNVVKSARNGHGKLRLDLSYAPTGFVNPGFELAKFDPRKYPWPLKNESVEEVVSAYMLCRIPGRERARFMNELYRVLIPAGKATIVSPYWSSSRAVQDFTHEWPPIVDQSFLYFTKGFREANGCKEEEYGLACDFDVTGGYKFEQETAARSADTQPFWTKRYLNAVDDIQVVLTKK
jgi:hypothetical protein